MNLNQEERDGYTVSAKMKSIWMVQLNLLSKLLDVCRDHNLRIWADGGTLLGAVRHKGYIPWDDDIDMAMFREDYDRLVALAPQAFQHPYFFQTAYSEKVPYPRGHAQLRMDDTAAILPFDINQDFHQGIFIDIFPYDTVPDSLSNREELIQTRNLMIDKMNQYTYGHYSLIHPSHNRYLRTIRHEINIVGFKAYFSAFEDLFRVFPLAENNTICCLSFKPDLNTFQRNKEWYEKTLLVPFEDYLIPIPAGYSEILTKQYGDYMTPIKAPSFHGGFLVLDPTQSYSKYLPGLRKKNNKKIWRERFRKLFKIK